MWVLKHPRDAGERGHHGGSSPFNQKRGREAKLPFHKQRWFHSLSRSTWTKFIAAFCTFINRRTVFVYFWYYFLCQHCCWTETSILGNIFCYCKFSVPPLICRPLQNRYPGVPDTSSSYILINLEQPCFKRNEKKNRKDTLTPKMPFTARFWCCATIDFNSTSKYFPSGYDNKLYITVFGIYRTICIFWTDELCHLYLLQVSASSWTTGASMSKRL